MIIVRNGKTYDTKASKKIAVQRRAAAGAETLYRDRKGDYFFTYEEGNGVYVIPAYEIAAARFVTGQQAIYHGTEPDGRVWGWMIAGRHMAEEVELVLKRACRELKKKYDKYMASREH